MTATILLLSKYFVFGDLVTPFDQLFIVLFLAAAVTAARAGILALRGRPRDALGTLRRLGLATVVYFVVLLVVSLATPRRSIPAGEDQFVIAREGAFPGCCIIADEGSLLHKRTVVRLP